LDKEVRKQKKQQLLPDSDSQKRGDQKAVRST